MPVNPYMNPGALIGSSSEQSLLDDLIIEGIQIHGLSVYYLPRTAVDLDMIYLEDPRVAFNDVVEIEMYLKSFDQFEGDGDFMSHMGVEIRDAATFAVSRTRFNQELGSLTPYALQRPREGDLLWYPLNQKLFEIKYVNKFAMHYPLGALFIWELKVELFEYAGQTIATGIEEIDRVMELSQDVLAMDDANTDPRTVDPLDDRRQIADETDDLIDFSELDVFSETKYGVRTKT